jgi:hypothetical protein
VLAGCGKSDARASVHPPNPPGLPADCGHAACGEGYFIDTVVEDGCSAGASCRVAVKLVATGDFHVNDEYPYRFKVQPTPGVELLGADPAGKNVFSKPAGDWAKTDAKSGTMTVRVTPTVKLPSTISGIFKLSVCSAQNCLIDQPEVRAVIAAR